MSFRSALGIVATLLGLELSSARLLGGYVSVCDTRRMEGPARIMTGYILTSIYEK